MPRRITLLVTREIYHVFNRTISGQPLFQNKKDYHRFLEIIDYYRYKNPNPRFSKFQLLPKDQREILLKNAISKNQRIVTIVAYCLMPNHFHIVLRQTEDYGITKFIGNISNSYSHYFNTKYNRKGPLFEGKFKAVRIEDDDQLHHVVRYVHLNPYSSHLLRHIQEIDNYSYSSFPNYLSEGNSGMVEKDMILSHFKTIKLYRSFVYDQADYQRRLHDLHHLILEKS